MIVNIFIFQNLDHTSLSNFLLEDKIIYNKKTIFK